MKKTITKTEWTYYVYVSKDSPLNRNRDNTELPDNEYWRGYFKPVVYTTLKEAEKSLDYYQKGYIEARRNVHTSYEYGGGNSYGSETKRIKTL